MVGAATADAMMQILMLLLLMTMQPQIKRLWESAHAASDNTPATWPMMMPLVLLLMLLLRMPLMVPNKTQEQCGVDGTHDRGGTPRGVGGIQVEEDPPPLT